MFKRSERQATCGRIVNCFSNQWIGPRPGFVLGPASADLGGGDVGNGVDVNIQFHGEKDQELLAACRRSSAGNTFTVPLYEPLDPGEGEALAKAGVTWAEWPGLQSAAGSPWVDRDRGDHPADGDARRGGAEPQAGGVRRGGEDAAGPDALVEGGRMNLLAQTGWPQPLPTHALVVKEDGRTGGPGNSKG